MIKNEYAFYVNPKFDTEFRGGIRSHEDIEDWFHASFDKLSDIGEGERDYARLSERLLLENKKDFLIWDDSLKSAEMTFFADQLPICGPSVDFCCGYAFWTSHVFGKIDVGVDLFPDEGGYKRPIEGFVKRDFIDNTYRSVLRADVTGTLPLPSESFQTVVSVCALEHIDRADLVLKNMFRILKPGGKLLISLQTDKFIEKIAEIFNDDYTKWFRNAYNLHTDRTWSAWRSLVEQSGFSIQSSRFIFSPEDTALHALSYWKNPVQPILGNLKLENAIQEIPKLRQHYFEQVKRWCRAEVPADQASIVCFVCTKI